MYLLYINIESIKLNSVITLLFYICIYFLLILRECTRYEKEMIDYEHWIGDWCC